VPMLILVGAGVALPALLSAVATDVLPVVHGYSGAASGSVKSQVDGAFLFGLSPASTLVAFALGLLVTMAWRTAHLPDNQLHGPVPEEAPVSAAETMRLAELLAGAIRIPTISYDKDADGGRTDTAQLLKLHAYLRKSFPLVHEKLRVDVVNGYSLLFEWKGSDDSLPPVMLCAHLDVVPAPLESQPWKHPPFEGVVDSEGVVWGRGAIDNKHNVLTQLAAIEEQLKRGTVPRRTVFVACGHDEEIGGHDGAGHIAKAMAERLGGRQLEFILDEGPFVLTGGVPGMTKPVAFIGTAEKGSVSARLRVSAFPPGHSSLAPNAVNPHGESNIAILARAVSKLEERPHPVYLDDFIARLRFLGRELPLSLRFLVANAAFFRPLLRWAALKTAANAATCRTTTAVTVLRSGSKINTVPGEASAWVNHRIHPRDGGSAAVLRRDAAIVNDPRVQIEKTSDLDVPVAPISPLDSEGFRALQRVVYETFNGAPVTPFLMIGNTDTRHYWELSKNIYRFTPIEMDMRDLGMFHGVNERLPSERLVRLRNFYERLLQQVAL
jgi:carboxypeptidase PM20D1